MRAQDDEGIPRGMLLAACALAVAGVAVVAWIAAVRDPAPPDTSKWVAPAVATECGKVIKDVNGRGWVREWIPAGSGCGPKITDVDSLRLRDGRICDYKYTVASDSHELLGLWCDVEKKPGVEAR